MSIFKFLDDLEAKEGIWKDIAKENTRLNQYLR